MKLETWFCFFLYFFVGRPNPAGFNYSVSGPQSFSCFWASTIHNFPNNSHWSFGQINWHQTNGPRRTHTHANTHPRVHAHTRPSRKERAERLTATELESELKTKRTKPKRQRLGAQAPQRRERAGDIDREREHRFTLYNGTFQDM